MVSSRKAMMHDDASKLGFLSYQYIIAIKETDEMVSFIELEAVAPLDGPS